MNTGNKPGVGKAKGRIPKLTPTKADGSPKEKSAVLKSARNYSDKTLKLLWGRAAGRCAIPICRIELFVTEPNYNPIWNIGEMGHVVGSSDAGPRADSSLKLGERDEYENLILLCRNCHSKIDGLAPIYPESRLLEIKANHESWVRTALPERGFSDVAWETILLQGEFQFDSSTIPEALAPDQLEEQLIIKVAPSRESWNLIKISLRTSIEKVLAGDDSISSRIAIFPLAPVSACICTGYLLTDRVNVRAFQYHRYDATWVWPKTEETLSAPVFEETADSTAKNPDVFFSFGLSASVYLEAMRESIGGEQSVYALTVSNPSISWLKGKYQLDELARKTREMFELASGRYPRSRKWHIFYAGPAPGAIVVGQQLNPTMIPSVQCYEFQNPDHIASILISKQDSILNDWTRDSTRP
jgi:hypothetical protein